MKTLKRISTLFVAALALLVPGVALAQEAGGIAQAGGAGYFAIAIALGIGLAAFGGALGQGRAASAAPSKASPAIRTPPTRCSCR